MKIVVVTRIIDNFIFYSSVTLLRNKRFWFHFHFATDYLFLILLCSTEEEKAHAQCAEKVRRSKWACFASLPPCRQQNPLRVVPSSSWRQHTARAVPARSVLDGLPVTIPLFAGACLALDPSKGKEHQHKIEQNQQGYKSDTFRLL